MASSIIGNRDHVTTLRLRECVYVSGGRGLISDSGEGPRRKTFFSYQLYIISKILGGGGNTCSPARAPTCPTVPVRAAKGKLIVNQSHRRHI